MLTVEKLSVKAGEELILDEVSLTIPAGETHILMGPNGSGKSTLLRAIMGLGDTQVVSGRIIFKDRDVTALSIDERARLGMGIAMQSSPSLPEVTLEGLAQVLGERYENDWRPLAAALNCEYLLKRGLNDRFSGGESKRAELFQLMIQRPQLLLVDEPESGVDLVNIAVVGKALKQLLKPEKIKNREHSGLIITHTGHILNYLNADQGYVLINGKLVCAGNPRDLFEEISKHGFEGCVACAECKRR
jgi:Fe-S cluster assembly ATP-binding protein